MKQQLEAEGISVQFSQATQLTENDLEELSKSADGGQVIVAIDDNTLGSQKSSEMAHLFTVARHYGCSIVLFWHSLFGGTNPARIISQNTAYFFLLSSPRLLYQVKSLGAQLNMHRLIVDAYNQVLAEPYGYILIDTSVRCPQLLRVRTKVLHQYKINFVFIPAL